MTAQRSPFAPARIEHRPAAGDQIEVTVTYLEQREKPALAAPPPSRRKTAIMRAENPPVHFYRYLYELIGAPYNWVSRRRMSDDELASIIHHEKVFLYVLYVDGVPAGMAEIDACVADTHELKFFGLAPDFIGAGLGRFFLANAVNLAWSGGPRRVRLETCSLDHPAALPLYQKFGFAVIDRRTGFIERLARPEKPSPKTP